MDREPVLLAFLEVALILKRHWPLGLALILLFGAHLYATDYGKVTTRKVADGVFLFTTTPYGDVGFCGNSVAILSDEGVLVFDSGATPATAATILAEIRKLTDKPVKYLVNSHWHWDHWGGNQVYRSAFPDLQIITHQKTLEQMTQVEPRWNDDGLKVQLPKYLEALEKKLQDLRAKKAPEQEIHNLEGLLKADSDFYEQKSSLVKTYPDVTFTDTKTLRPGGREIDILHARAITVGDTYLYLPKEKILITGDIMLNPYPYAIGGSYPADWLKTLESFAQLRPAMIIPGHGEPRSDPAFLQGQITLFQEVMRLLRTARTKGMKAEQAVASVNNQASVLASKMGFTDAQTVAEFQSYFLNVFAARAFEELNHPLGDLPNGLPGN